MWSKVNTSFFLLIFLAPLVHANQCLPLGDDQKARIIIHLSKWLDVSETEKLSIQSDQIVPGTCYRKLVVKGHTLRPRSFFLSADQRFLPGPLLDLTSAPEEERTQAQKEINYMLLSDPS